CPLKFLSIHPPSLACHHRPYPGPRPRSTLETHPEPIRRTSLQAQAAGHRGDAASGWWGSGGALPETPEQKYRLIYLSAPPWAWGRLRAVVVCGAVSKGRGTLRQPVGCNAYEDCMLCSCTPAMDKGPQHAFAPHISRG